MERILQNYPYTDGESYDPRFELERGHLTPAGDQLFPTWRWSTYFYINVAGMWDKVNNGNWGDVEEKVRSFASIYKVNLTIFTGTYGTLKLCENCPDLTLDNGNIPVPKWLWKVVKDPKADRAIAFVVSNNPFMLDNRICGSQDKLYDWPLSESLHVKTNKRVVASVCTVDELKHVVKHVPQQASASGDLKGRKIIRIKGNSMAVDGAR